MKTLSKISKFLTACLFNILIAQGVINLAAGDVTLNPTITFNGKEATEGILEEAFKKPVLSRHHTVVGGIKAKQQIAFLERFNKITLQDTGCGTGKSEKEIPMHEKFWDPVPTKIWLTPCWADFVSSFFVWSIKAGIQREDLSNTDLAEYLMEVISDAAYEDVLRMVWFSDTAAAVYGSGGKLASADDVKYYNMFSGLFDQIITGVAIALGTWGHIPNHTIDANALATFSAQLNGLADGESRDIFRGLLVNADRRLLQHPDRFILCTQTIFDNWADYKESKNLESSFKNEDTQLWESIFRSTPIIPMPIWDQYIQGDFHDTVKYDKPHRAILTVPGNLQVGFDGPSEYQNFEAFRDKSTDLYHIKGGYKIDAKFMQGYLASVAGF